MGVFDFSKRILEEQSNVIVRAVVAVEWYASKNAVNLRQVERKALGSCGSAQLENITINGTAFSATNSAMVRITLF